MSKQLKIFKLPEDEETLRAANAEISFPLSDEIRALIDDMKQTVREAPGIGLAAPQIGKNLMLAIVNLEELGPPFAVINPKILSKSIKKDEMEEGCLSIPGWFTKVKRPARVEVEAFLDDGSKVVFKADGLFAKVLQHEIDHLNGVLIRDK